MNKEERDKQALIKLNEMKTFEKELYSKGIKYIAGVDEVGRGPLAGPVVAAAVILPADFDLLYVDDSKKLSEAKRELIFTGICEKAVCYGIGIVDNFEIDKINILEATKKAMSLALAQLTVTPEHVLIDALTLKNLSVPQTGIVKGDSKSVSIAAASIIAKVTRDKLMVNFGEEYPSYGFCQNKGYGTKAHYEGIKKYGITQIHRLSFLKNLAEKFDIETIQDDETQMTILSTNE